VFAQDICVPFVVVGTVVEPRVAFSKPSLNFGQVLVNRTGRQALELVNSEAVPFDFALDRATFDATDEDVKGRGRPPLVNFEPCRGAIAPNSSLQITATYKPDGEAAVNYSVVCHVKQKPTPLVVNVKGAGYAVREHVAMEAPDGQEVELSATVRTKTPQLHNMRNSLAIMFHPWLRVQAETKLDLGQVTVHEKCVRLFHVVNAGCTPFDFEWRAGDEPRLTVTPPQGRVGAGERAAVELCYHPTSSHKLKGQRVSCRVSGGRTYKLMVSGAGHRPKLRMSFTAHDFGKVYRHEEGANVVSKELLFRNDDTKVRMIVLRVQRNALLCYAKVDSSVASPLFA
jgi:hydrocephalus-inducing protein